MHYQPHGRPVIFDSYRSLQLRLFLALLLMSAPLMAQTTRTAASCSVTDIQTQVNLSSDGDTVLVPGGTSCPTGSHATWNTALTVNVGIVLNGQNAFINFGTSGSLTVNADTGHGAYVTGFNFNTGFINGGCPITFNQTASTKTWRFGHNAYTDSGAAGGPVTMVCTSGLGPGLIDDNTFTSNNGADEIIHVLGNGGSWTDDLIPGSLNMVYIETNTFTEHGPAGCSAEEAFGGGEQVFRYNTLNQCQNDVHDGTSGSRWAEIYQNTYNVSGTYVQANTAQLRGGSGLYYSNHSTGSPCCSDPYPGLSVGPDCPSSDTCSGAWPVAQQVGRGVNETTYSPLYLWGNDSVIQSSIGASGGQSLVNVGASPTACTGGHAGNVCDAITSTSLPTLERCQSAADVTAGCPVTYSYTAAPYPNPLINQTWFVRNDGGTRFSSHATSGQCNGLFDVSYASTGVD